MTPDPPRTLKLTDVPFDPGRTDISPAPGPARPAVSEAYLVHIHPRGPTFGLRHHVGSDPVVIGRQADCQVCDPDPSVSRRHARVELRPDGRFHVTDLGSTNGTFVNHARAADAALGDGDYLRVGSSVYRFLAGDNIEAEYHEELHRLAVTDPLTGLPNRRALSEFLARECDRARRHRRPLSVVLFDVDHFKAVNDRLGHVGGDHTLRGVAAAVRPVARRDELLARYGGEEFALVLPEAGPAQAARCGERVRRAVASCPFEFEGERYAVTVSVGVGSSAGGEEVGPDVLLARADARLYEAKRGGRDRVCF